MSTGEISSNKFLSTGEKFQDPLDDIMRVKQAYDSIAMTSKCPKPDVDNNVNVTDPNLSTPEARIA